MIPIYNIDYYLQSLDHIIMQHYHATSLRVVAITKNPYILKFLGLEDSNYEFSE